MARRSDPGDEKLANVYVTGWMSREGFDIVLAAGTFDEALAAYHWASGRPGEVTEQHEHEGVAVWYLDQELGFQGFISRYRVLVSEFPDDGQGPHPGQSGRRSL